MGAILATDLRGLAQLSSAERFVLVCGSLLRWAHLKHTLPHAAAFVITYVYMYILAHKYPSGAYLYLKSCDYI